MFFNVIVFYIWEFILRFFLIFYVFGLNEIRIVIYSKYFESFYKVRFLGKFNILGRRKIG